MEQIRYVTLRNGAAYVARIQIQYKNIISHDGESKCEGQWRTWETHDYHDIMLSHERTVDLADVDEIQDGAKIRLQVFVVAGRDLTANDIFEYRDAAAKTAAYTCKGTTLFNSLHLDKLH
ncbi:MAG: hypothetical protein LBH76_09870 [Propionibacteriaceae bacterium]|jgi:hypothetical protein|nr:hypothetical protein [Propionibacteriaceae bacterium]